MKSQVNLTEQKVSTTLPKARYLMRVALLFIKVFLILRFYRGISYLLFVFCKCEFDKSSKKKRVLYLSKPIFNDDVIALKKYGGSFDYIRFPRMLLRPILKHFVNYADELNDANYYIRTKEDPSIIALRSFWNDCLPYLKKKLSFDIILSGNFVYVTQQEMFNSAKNHGIKTAVLYKEGMFPSDRNNDVIDIFYTTKEFNADKILFYNQSIRDILVKSDLPGMEKEKTALVGVPRFDYLANKKERGHSFNGKVTLFAFDPRQKSEYLLENSAARINFEEVLFSFQKDFVSLCIGRPEIKLVIKSKPDPVSRDFVQRLIKECDILTLPKNIVVSHTLSPQKLIRDSGLVLGYSSTTLIEALIQKKIVACPDVSYFFNNRSPDLFGEHKLGVHYISSIPEMEDLIAGKIIVDRSSSEQDLEDFLATMMYKTDGKASQRVENEMINLLWN